MPLHATARKTFGGRISALLDEGAALFHFSFAGEGLCASPGKK